MSTKLTGYIKSFGNAGFIAGVNEWKGMVEQANSPQGALEKLILALQIKTAFEKKISVESVSVTISEPTNAVHNPDAIPQKELNLVLQS